MSNRISLQNLLNPVPKLSVPISQLLNPLPPEDRHPEERVNASLQRKLIHQNYRLNHKTLLSEVYEYPVGSILEYPETGTTKDEAVGHLFRMKEEDWCSPGVDFAYSRGEPRGNSRFPVTVPLLVDAEDNMVPCIIKHSTCQGVKTCPHSYLKSMETSEISHSSATREHLQKRLKHDQWIQEELNSPSRSIFEATSAFITAVQRLGCTSGSQTSESSVTDPERALLRRGYPEATNHCTGSIVFGYSDTGIPFIKCQYHSLMNREHYFDNTIGNGRFDLDYLEAVLVSDHEEVARIEAEAQEHGYGPRTACYTVMNNTAQRSTCPWNHRDPVDGQLKQPFLISLRCDCTYREFHPLDVYRKVCPYILVVSKGVHTHPIPLPEKTPASVKLELEDLLHQLEYDLADITPRLFLRHPILKSFLNSRFPLIRNPMLSDLHISLSNRSHLKVYIDAVKKSCFPEGTGWKGLQHVKAQQDSLLDQSEQYIRFMVEFPTTDHLQDEDDEPPTDDSSMLRIVICMTTEGSSRLAQAQHLQSDISFKRVIGFYEFELASVDAYSNTSITFCRVFLNKQTAFAHKETLKLIDQVLALDVGRKLHWRHIHGNSIDDYDKKILNWVVDQHRGQAKGIGLYLQEICQLLPPKLDFHEPLRLIQDLGPYDHLRRFLTLCTTHYYRNVKQCSVSEEVRQLMRGLVCVYHLEWDQTINAIWDRGGQAGRNWLLDKQQSGFVFAAICWERSYIPQDIWQARRRESNVAEIVHANVNLEGKNCTLVGAVGKGKHYDVLKQRSLKNREDMGIRESYKSKHLYENAMHNYKRKGRARAKALSHDDEKINQHNRLIQAALDHWKTAQSNLQTLALSLSRHASSSASGPSDADYRAYQKAVAAENKAKTAFEKQTVVGQRLRGKGTGKVFIALP